jgi:hypothetical protein
MLRNRDSDPNLVLPMNWVDLQLESCSIPTQAIHLKFKNTSISLIITILNYVF